MTNNSHKRLPFSKADVISDQNHPGMRSAIGQTRTFEKYQNLG